MIFNKKDKVKRCEECGSKAEQSFSFCPNCGNSFLDPQKEQEDFGMLGRNDISNPMEGGFGPQGFGITDKLINSIFNSMMKNLDKQFKNQFKDLDRGIGNSEVKAFPNGVRIKVSGPFDNKPKKSQKKKVSLGATREVDEGQMKKMNSLPRVKAKTNVKRVGDRVVYELSTPGIESPEDVFISKLESGYEVKVIGSKKVYVNSVPINLPLKKYSITKSKLLVEFNAGQPQVE